jgi:hypothetical protein
LEIVAAIPYKFDNDRNLKTWKILSDSDFEECEYTRIGNWLDSS